MTSDKHPDPVFRTSAACYFGHRRHFRRPGGSARLGAGAASGYDAAIRCAAARGLNWALPGAEALSVIGPPGRAGLGGASGRAGWPEAVAAVPAAAIVTVDRRDSVPRTPWRKRSGSRPVIGFLAAVLVIAQAVRRRRACSGTCGACEWPAGPGGQPRAGLRLLHGSSRSAAATTAVLSAWTPRSCCSPRWCFIAAARLRIRSQPARVRVHAPGELRVACCSRCRT